MRRPRPPGMNFIGKQNNRLRRAPASSVTLSDAIQTRLSCWLRPTGANVSAGSHYFPQRGRHFPCAIARQNLRRPPSFRRPPHQSVIKDYSGDGAAEYPSWCGFHAHAPSPGRFCRRAPVPSCLTVFASAVTVLPAVGNRLTAFTGNG